MRHIALACTLAFLIAVGSSCGSDSVETADTDTAASDTTESSVADEPATSADDDGDQATTTTRAPAAGDDSSTVPETVTTDGPATSPTTKATPATTDEGAGNNTDGGTVNVSLEPVQGIFTEGFEVGLRFETADGKAIDATLWSDFVQSAGNTSPGDYYNSVLHQEVPAGSIIVLATSNIGLGPAPQVPDINGKLNCRLVVDVPAGGEVDVEVAFGGNDCLSLK